MQNNNNSARFRLLGFTVAVWVLIPFRSFAAYPIVDGVQGLPYPELITVYPDDSNKDLYYFIPTSLSFVYEKKPDGSLRPRLGVQYWGISGSDVDGAGGNFAFSVQPAIDKDKIDAVVKELKKTKPNAHFAFPALVSSKMELIINGQLVSQNQDKSTPTSTSGGTVDATQGFAIGLSRLGARIFAQGAAPDSDVFAARYTYKFTGIAKRLHAKITIYDRRVYDHFRATANASAWYGMVKSSWAADWQKLVTDGAIKLEYLEGGDTEGDNYMLEIFKTIVNARVNQEGMFKPELKPGRLPTAESQKFGWGFSSSAAWEHLEETHNFAYEINKAKLEDREFNIGLSFNAVCAKYPDSFADITRPPAKCIDKNNFATILKDVSACIKGKLTFYKGLLDQGLINQATYDSKASKVLDEVCYKDEIASIAVNAIAPAFAPVMEGLKTGRLGTGEADAIVSHGWIILIGSPHLKEKRPSGASQMSLSTVKLRSLGIVLLSQGFLSVAGLGNARSAILLPISGMSISDNYDVFQIGDDLADLANAKIAVIPKRLEFVKDPATGRSKFGLQYSFAPGNPPFVSLTASVRYHNDRAEISAIVAEAENKLGLAAGTLKVSSLGIFGTRISFFVKEGNGTTTQIPVNTAASPLDGSYAISLDLSKRSRVQLQQLFDGSSEPIGGFIGVTEASAGIFERKNATLRICPRSSHGPRGYTC